MLIYGKDFLNLNNSEIEYITIFVNKIHIYIYGTYSCFLFCIAGH